VALALVGPADVTRMCRTFPVVRHCNPDSIGVARRYCSGGWPCAGGAPVDSGIIEAVMFFRRRRIAVRFYGACP
jgi:hypothetical protein